MASSLRFLANLFHVFGYFALFFLFYSYKCSVYGARELASRQLDHQNLSLLTASPCTASTKGLQVAHKNGLYSPLGHENPSPASGEPLLQDQFRVRSLKSIIPQGDVLPLQEIPDTRYFGVKVGFGTTKLDLTLMFDTGSKQTWIRCQRCSQPNCTESIFDPSKSSTFSYPMIDDCKSPSPYCPFTADYRDDSHAGGYYAEDTISFSSTAIFFEFIFGCVQNINGGFPSSAAGILGLEVGKYSLMSQTYNTFKQIFCYCIPAAKGSNGYLVYGDQALQACSNNDITVSLNTKDDRYYVNLVGITIDGKRLTSADSNSLSLALLDTGTPIGRLPKSVYAELSSLFQQMMSQLFPNATKPTVGSTDVCYDIGGLQSIEVPTMTLLFDDFKELKLDTNAIVYREGDSQVCLAFVPSEDKLTIIGNLQQRNLMVRYDVLGQEVAFGVNGCSS